MVRELYIDDQRVDLPDDIRFQLTFQIADFGDLSPRGSGSNTIKLPKTPRNVGIFGRCNFVQVASNFPYALHSAYYYEDGFLVFNDATVYMLAITEKDFEIQCVWGNATEIRRLKALDMGNVAGLGNVNYGAEAYAIIETGEDETNGEIGVMNLAVTKNGLLSAYTRGLLSVEKTLRAIGMNIDVNSDIYNYYLKDLYIFPAIKSIKGRTRLKFSGVYNATFYNYLPDPSRPQNLISASAASFTPVNDTIAIRDTYHGKDVLVPYAITGKSVELNINVDIKSASSISGNWLLVVSYKIINTEHISKYESYNIGPVTSPRKINYKTEFLIPEDTDGIVLSLYPEIQNSSQYIQLHYTCEIDMLVNKGVNYDIDVVMPRYNINNSGTYQYPAPRIGFFELLRGTTAFDFLSACLMNSGAIFGKDSDLTDVYTYTDITQNSDNMLDWTEKLVYIKEEEFLNKNAGAKNWVKYRQSDKYNGYGDGYFENDLEIQLEKEDKEIVSNPIFSFNNGIYAFLGKLDSAIIPMFSKKEDGEIEFTGDGGLWLVKLGERDDFPLINDENKVISGGEYTRTISPMQPTFNNIKDTNWSSYIAMQQQYRKAKAIFMLSPRDVAELDFKKPIYLRQYAQAYVVTKVNYQPHASTVEMMLIR